MEIKEAITAASVQNPIPMDELEARFTAEYAHNSQRRAKALGAVAALRAGMADLASLGHRFDLVEWNAPAVLVFPKMLYKRDGDKVLERQVESSDEDEEAQSDGWMEDPKCEPTSQKSSPVKPKVSPR